MSTIASATRASAHLPVELPESPAQTASVEAPAGEPAQATATGGFLSSPPPLPHFRWGSLPAPTAPAANSPLATAPQPATVHAAHERRAHHVPLHGRLHHLHAQSSTASPARVPQLPARVAHLERQATERYQALAGQGEPGALRALSRTSQALQAVVERLRGDPDAAALTRVKADFQQRFAAQAADKTQFDALLHQAFGDKFDAGKAEAIRQQALAGDFSWMPKIELRSSQQLADASGTQGDGVAQGAYAQATDTIYLSREVLRADPAAAERVLMEEVGHGIDARINTSDAAGDEGEIFSRLMHGEHLSATELAAMKADNDGGTIKAGGKDVQVEYNFLKKAVKAVTGGIKKVTQAVVHGAVGLAKSAFTVTVGLATFNFQKVQQGLRDGFDAVKDSTKEVIRAVKDTTKQLHRLTKEAFQKVMQSKLFAAVLMVARFIPIPVVQLAVQVVNMVRAAYMVYQGVKNHSLGAVIGGVASLAGGGAKLAEAFGASASTVSTISNVAGAASKLSAAYQAVASQDLSAALSLVGGNSGTGPAAGGLGEMAGYARQAIGIGQALRHHDTLGALEGSLTLAGQTSGPGSALTSQLGQAREVVTTLHALDAARHGRADQALTLAGQTGWGQQVQGWVKSQLDDLGAPAPRAERPVLLASAGEVVSDAGNGLGGALVQGQPYRPGPEADAFMQALTQAMQNPGTTGPTIRLDDFGRPVPEATENDNSDIARESYLLASRTHTISSTAPDGLLVRDGRSYFLINRDEQGVGVYQSADVGATAPAPAAARNTDAAQRGQLSARYETGGRGASTVSSGVGDPGGVSYGSYQLASRLGRPQEFLANEGAPWAAQFGTADPTERNGTFAQTWRQVAQAEPEAFAQAQHRFVERTHYDVAVSNILEQTHLDINEQPAAMQDVVWSTAVQHGPNNQVVARAYRNLGAVDVAAPDFSERLINAIYDERSRTRDDGRLVYFRNSSEAVQNGLRHRFANERQDALEALRGR